MSRLAITFTGEGAEFRKVWLRSALLNLLLTGFYTPIARRRNAQYLVGHTLLDGSPMFPGEIQFSANDVTFAQSHAASWTGSVLAGSHTVQMQFRTETSGQSVFMHRHTTEVVHR